MEQGLPSTKALYNCITNPVHRMGNAVRPLKNYSIHLVCVLLYACLRVCVVLINRNGMERKSWWTWAIIYKYIKNEVGCRDDTVPKTGDTRRHCEVDLTQSSTTPKKRDVGRGVAEDCCILSTLPRMQCLLVSLVFGRVSSLHPTSFLMIFFLHCPGPRSNLFKHACTQNGVSHSRKRRLRL